MSIKGCLFDFDGTLFFNSELHKVSISRIFVKYYNAPAPDYPTMTNQFFGRPNADVFRSYVNPNATDEEVKYFDALKEQDFRNLCLERKDDLHLVDGAVELLDYLKDNNIPLCMATGAPISNVNFYREQFGIDRWFGDGKLLYADGSFPGKPAPDIYIMAAKQLGLDPSECIVFEDGTSGIIAAHDAGCGGIVAVYDERFELPDSAKAMVDSIHHDLTDWKNILSGYGL